MLMNHFIAATMILLLLSEVRADAVEVPSALHARRGLTAGGYDHFFGQLHPDGTTLYFAGNANSTVEIFTQNLVRGIPKLLFDESADVNQTRISPDGAFALYISYRESATGDVCIFDLGTRSRRCLGKAGVTIAHVFWFHDSEHIGILSRERPNSENQLWKVSRRARRVDAGQLLFKGNMLAPVASPDGKWLVYAPLSRITQDTDSSDGIMRTEPGLMLLALDETLAHPTRFLPDLPGTSGFPAFSIDGHYLYFTQYLNDSNFDGKIDGNDNDVLFREPFASAIGRLDVRKAEQLTSGSHNCQYPTPSRDRLIATCARAGYLQIYSLPLAGHWLKNPIQNVEYASSDAW
jgi:cellulose synthase operon protein C